MAKKEKSVEKMRKSYKRRGIFYSVVIILMIIATVLVNINSVERAINKAVFPKSEILTIEGEKKEVFSEVTTVDGQDVSSYYILDKDGKKVVLSPYYKLTKLTMIQTSFISGAKVRLTIIKSVVTAVLVFFCILMVIYLMRISYYISNKDDELKAQIGDKMTNLRVKRDKLATKLSKKSSKKNK